MSARVADNPHKPGTPEHKAWEIQNIHDRRDVGFMTLDPEWVAAKGRADARLAALKKSMQHIDTSVDDLLDEIERLNDPPPRPMVGLLGNMSVAVNGFDLSKYVTNFVLHTGPVAPMPMFGWSPSTPSWPSNGYTTSQSVTVDPVNGWHTFTTTWHSPSAMDRYVDRQRRIRLGRRLLARKLNKRGHA